MKMQLIAMDVEKKSRERIRKEERKNNNNNSKMNNNKNNFKNDLIHMSGTFHTCITLVHQSGFVSL